MDHKSYGDERLPRYTSYPTAPRFGAQVGTADYAGWLAALAPGTALSLYVHVPFCRAMCWYCGCNTTVALRDGPVAAYVDTLRREIDLVAAQVAGPVDVRHIHFGGGTPTILTPEDFAGIVAQIRRRFAVSPQAELAIEIDPRHLGTAMVTALAQAGINRASLGVQSFDPAVQQAINRVQSVAQTEEAVGALRKAGIAAINLDLIYGLPRQSVRSCIETIERALPLRPDRLSIFGYAHVPQFKKHQRRIADAELPGGEERLEQAEAMARRLVEAGYVRIGLDHFARPDDPMAVAAQSGGLRRNFQGYTTDPCDALIGFGASAIGRLPQGYVQNETVIGAYAARVAQGEIPVARGYALTADDRLRAELIERLMCDFEVDIATVCARHGAEEAGLAASLDRLAPLCGAGIVTRDGSRIRVAEHARLLVRKAASAFDAYLDEAGRQFSRAV